MARRADSLGLDSHIESLYRKSLDFLRQNRPLRVRSSAVESTSKMLSEPEREALRRVGANLAPWADARRDPLKATVADYMALLESSYSTRKVADFLKVDPSRVRQRIRERSLYGLEYEGEWRLPRFQFERSQVLPGLAEVLEALRPEVSPLDVAEWFLSPHPDLESAADTPLSPREWLLRGLSAAPVTALAREL